MFTEEIQKTTAVSSDTKDTTCLFPTDLAEKRTKNRAKKFKILLYNTLLPWMILPPIVGSAVDCFNKRKPVILPPAKNFQDYIGFEFFYNAQMLRFRPPHLSTRLKQLKCLWKRELERIAEAEEMEFPSLSFRNWVHFRWHVNNPNRRRLTNRLSINISDVQFSDADYLISAELERIFHPGKVLVRIVEDDFLAVV